VSLFPTEDLVWADELEDIRLGGHFIMPV